ncbi:hypothetical protein PIB30_041380 [Stylosanthes scabra]|uniref:Uncharacterized protein n=1 Tax=Stylosanthes scabra TaxID=79078 RepID=A0ABU6QGD4_9FABA|nr:hypothetical protein [Stylosanthes scabra]
MANKNGVTLTISVLMSLAILCSAIDQFYETTIPEDTWTASYFIGGSNSQLDVCVSQCKHSSPSFKKSCIIVCIERECKKLHPNDEKQRRECIDRLKAEYNVDKLVSELQFK